VCVAGRAEVEAAPAGVDVAVGDAAVLDAAVLDAAAVEIAGAAEVIGSVTGREALVLCGVDGVRSATGSAELIPMATTAQPATASDAVAAPTTRPTDMGSVCQVWLL
jgi:hypothetical protein